MAARRGAALVVWHLIEHQYVLHGGHGLTAQLLGETPLTMLPGFKCIFFKSARMVSGEIVSTKPSSTALSASMRSVQRSCPSGTVLQASAMRCACCGPRTGQRLAKVLLALVGQHGLYSAFLEARVHAHRGVAAHVEGAAHVSEAPAVPQFE
jgi:hypothetical protein